MKVSEVVGQRIKQARRAGGLTQKDLGQELRNYLPGAWPVQAVSAAEQGRREFTAVELAALALILKKPVGWFFLPTADETVQFPRGKKTKPSAFARAASAGSGGEVAEEIAQLRKHMRDLAKAVQRLEEGAVAELLEDMHHSIVTDQLRGK